MRLDPLYCCLIPALLYTSAPACADTHLTYTDSGVGNTPRTTSIQIHADKVRMEEIGSSIYSLYDHTRQTLYTVNTQAGQYIETNPEKLKLRAEKMLALQAQMKAQMQQQMAQLPEDQRRIAEERMQQAEAMMKTPAPVVSRKDTGRHEQVQGIDCKISELSFGPTPVREICNADTGLIDTADFDMLLAMFTYMDKMAIESAHLQGVTPPPAEAGSASIHGPGLALRVQAVPNGPRSELGSISKEVLDGKLFELPTGFQPFEPSAPPPAN